MTPRSSLYMQTLAQCGSVTRAADRLYITPSALSKYISALEREVGMPLFSRVGKQFVLTHAGERYLDWCLRMNALQAQMESEMYDLSGQKTGRLRVGCQTSVTDFLVDWVVPEFMERYPEVLVSISDETSRPLLQKMKAFQLDAAISTKPPDGKPFHQEPLLSMEQVLLVHREHPLAARAVHRPGHPYPWVDPAWCRGERFVMMHPGQTPRETAQKLLAPVWEDIRIVMEVHSTRAMLDAAQRRIGIVQSGALMDRMYSNRWDDLVKLSFGERHQPMVYWLYYHREIYRSAALEAFLDMVRKRFRRFAEEMEERRRTNGRQRL